VLLRSPQPGRFFLGVDRFSTAYSEFDKGEPAEDAQTKRGFRSGPFAGVERVHFSEEPYLRELLIVPKVLAVYTAFHGYDKRTA